MMSAKSAVYCQINPDRVIVMSSGLLLRALQTGVMKFDGAFKWGRVYRVHEHAPLVVFTAS